MRAAPITEPTTAPAMLPLLILWCELDGSGDDDDEEGDVPLNRAARGFELKPSVGDVDVAFPVALFLKKKRLVCFTSEKDK